jgi:hypothetical protein
MGGWGMASPKQPDGTGRHSSNRKMGVEFSGLEGVRDFLVAFLFLAILMGVAMVIAFVAFG